MTRGRLPVTVDAELLRHTQQLNPAMTTARIIDEALSSLISDLNTAVDAAYAVAYEMAPLAVPDEWGSLEDFGTAVRPR